MCTASNVHRAKCEHHAKHPLRGPQLRFPRERQRSYPDSPMVAARHESLAPGLFFANQLVILVSQWWVGLLRPEVAWLALGFAPPAVVGGALGMHLFTAVDHTRLRRLVFALLFILGLTLCLQG